MRKYTDAELLRSITRSVNDGTLTLHTDHQHQASIEITRLTPHLNHDPMYKVSLYTYEQQDITLKTYHNGFGTQLSPGKIDNQVLSRQDYYLYTSDLTPDFIEYIDNLGDAARVMNLQYVPPTYYRSIYAKYIIPVRF